MSATRLHPDKFDHAHIDSIETFAHDFQHAMKGSFPRESDPYPYTSVTVLLLRWEEDDLDIKDEISDLDKVFSQHFGFDTEVWCIPSSATPTRALQRKLFTFQDAHQNEKELLIVYYGGHSEAEPYPGRSIWRANCKDDSPSLDWSALQPLLETAVPSVLIILDCCVAANAACAITTGTTKELLAACGRENPISGVGERSFTSALIDELTSFGSDPFTVAMLHSRLVTMRWRLKNTPFYALLSEHVDQSIHLQTHPSKKIETEHTPPGRTQKEATRVLLAITIKQNAKVSLDTWVQWLQTGAPKAILGVDARLEAIFESHSTLAMISIPIESWDRLREDEAYQFVGFIQSSNLLQGSDVVLGPTGSKAFLRALPANPAQRPGKSYPKKIGIPDDEIMGDSHTMIDHPRGEMESLITDSGHVPERGLSGNPSRPADYRLLEEISLL